VPKLRSLAVTTQVAATVAVTEKVSVAVAARLPPVGMAINSSRAASGVRRRFMGDSRRYLTCRNGVGDGSYPFISVVRWIS